MAKFHIDKIDGARGIAILLVLLYHTQLILFPGYESTAYDRNGILILHGLRSIILNFNPVAQGGAGVDLFLVISGFLIHLIYLKSGSRFNIKTFFSKRFWRIYPPYLIALLIFFCFTLDFSSYGIKDLLAHIFLVHNLNDRSFLAINPSYWSIALEAQLYLIYPVYLLLLKRLGNKKSLALVFALQLLLNLWGYLYDCKSLAYITFVLNYWFIWCIGAYLASCFYNHKKIFSRPLLWFMVFLVMIAVFKMFSYTKYFIATPVSLACIAFLETILYYDRINSLQVSRQTFKILSYVGLISYSIYLLHQPLLPELMRIFNLHTRSLDLNLIVSVLCAWAVIIAVSSIYYRLEVKSINLGRKRRNKL